MQEHDEDNKAIEKPKEEAVIEGKVQADDDPELAKALADGYNPKDPKGLTPREYNVRGPLFDVIDKKNKQLTSVLNEKKRQDREITELKQMIADIGAKMSKSEARTYEREAHELQRQRLEAVQYGDLEKFNQLDQQYRALQASLPEPTKPPPVPALSDDAKQFLERNQDWFNSDTVENHIMKKAAIEFENDYLQARELEGKPPLTPAVLSRRIEEFVKAKFPHRFENPESTKPPAVAGGGGSTVGKETSANMDELSPFQQDVFLRMKKADPSFTVDKYLKTFGKRSLVIE